MVCCSLCGSPNTNKKTCPLNEAASHPNLLKHPNASAFILAEIVSVAPAVPQKSISVPAVAPQQLIVTSQSKKPCIARLRKHECVIDIPDDHYVIDGFEPIEKKKSWFW